MSTTKKAARAAPPPKRAALKAEATEPRVEKERRLTPKQEAFVCAYLANGCNASAAYREAYGAENMNQPTVAREASRLLQHPLVAPMIAEHRETLAKTYGITTERVIKELTNIALADIGNVATWTGKATSEETKNGKVIVRGANDVVLKSSEEIEPNTRAAVAEIAQTAHGVRVKMHDKSAALDKLGRYLGIFKDQGPGGIDVNIAFLQILSAISNGSAK